MFSDKAARERLGCVIKREVDRHNYVDAILIVFEPCGLVAIAIKPFSHFGHLTREIRRGQPNLHDLHEFPSQAIPLCAKTGRRASHSIG
jgi:hypothetical protein